VVQGGAEFHYRNISAGYNIFALAFWIKWTENYVNFDKSVFRLAQNGFGMEVFNKNVYPFLNGGPGATTQYQFPVTPWTLGKIDHWVIVFDRTQSAGNTCKFYENGIFIDKITAYTDNYNSEAFLLATQGVGGSCANISNIKMLPFSPSVADIKKLMNSERGGMNDWQG
jgi:hypothetical protein